MIIDFKFDYEVEVVLHGGRKAKKMFTESQMSVNVKSITRDDVRTVALLKRDKSFNQFRNANLTGGFIIDYLEYEKETDFKSCICWGCSTKAKRYIIHMKENWIQGLLVVILLVI